MKRRHDLKGMTFGKWLVEEFSHLNKSRSAYWYCKCSCGTRKIVSALNLRKGQSTKCRSCSGKEKVSVYQQGGKRKYIYLFKLHKYYKIGVSDNPQKRLDQINRTTPYLAKIIKIANNYPGLERNLHSVFKEKQVKGEWFMLEKEDLKIFEQTLACTSMGCEL